MESFFNLNSKQMEQSSLFSFMLRFHQNYDTTTSSKYWWKLKVARWKKPLCINSLNTATFYPQRTEIQAFVLVFVRNKTEFFTAKHWLSWLPFPVTQKLVISLNFGAKSQFSNLNFEIYRHFLCKCITFFQKILSLFTFLSFKEKTFIR